MSSPSAPSPHVRDAGSEQAFETHVEHQLLTIGGYEKGRNEDFSRALALDTKAVLAFVQRTQPKAWEKLSAIHGERVEKNFLNRLFKELENWGTVHVLRRGVVDYGVPFRLAYFRPPTTRNPEAVALYEQNRLSVFRQLHHSEAHPKRSIDLVLCVNGLPTATVELKDPLKGQRVEDACEQYRTQRDPREKLLQFKKRAVVHFAVDPDAAFMTTQLAGRDTRFLPFNKGFQHGAGNPPNPLGHRTAYLWQEVWARDPWLDILGRYVQLEREEFLIDGVRTKREKLIFPRYHQLRVVKRLERDVVEKGAGKNYLIQHSAGSGKSNTISWLAHRFADLHGPDEERVFHSVVVVTDRRVLDQQLQDTVFQMEHKRGVVVPIEEDSEQLARALETGVRVVITTLQKFPFAIEHIETLGLSLPDARYAVIVDEAHSSQSGDAAEAMKAVLGGLLPEDGADVEDVIAARMQARKAEHSNLSFFAFTATPKPKTLEAFGQPDADGTPQPFDLYSMRQAIEERFILDVLQNYTTYQVFYKLAKQIDDDPALEKRQARRALARYVQLHPHNVAQKVRVIVEHFRAVTMTKIGGQAKAMVVTGSRREAVDYKQEIDRYIQERGYDHEEHGAIRTLVAFSGTVKDEYDLEWTERGMNGFPESQLPEKFERDEYRVLIVAEKYQTGFDQPLLHTMYVDRKLAGVRAVQTLSRLNRTYPGKEDTFVLDFQNNADEIQAAFAPYYETTLLTETADPNQLYDLRTKLEAADVLRPVEVEAFAEAFFRPYRRRRSEEHAAFHRLLDPAVERFRALDEEGRDVFKGLLASFLRLYSFLAQVMPFEDAVLEKLYAYGRLLATKLRDLNPNVGVAIQDEVALEYYRLQKMSEGAISLRGDGAVSGPSAVGTGGVDESRESLSSIISLLNERFATEFKPADRIFFEQMEEALVENEKLAQQARTNSLDNFRYPFREQFFQTWIDRMDKNQELTDQLFEDETFAEDVRQWFERRVYNRLQAEEHPHTPEA